MSRIILSKGIKSLQGGMQSFIFNDIEELKEKSVKSGNKKCHYLLSDIFKVVEIIKE